VAADPPGENEGVPGRFLTGLSLEELSQRLESRTRALVVRKWLFGPEPVPEVLPQRLPGVRVASWSRLREETPLPSWRLAGRQVAADGTVKLALAFQEALVETVLIPAARRSTVCLSSQAGCTRRCAFCATAALGFTRHLTGAEMVLQYALGQAQAPPNAPARNAVFMGMGEPMDNLDEVMTAVDRLLEPGFPCLAEDHVTVSTSGVLPGLRRFLREGRGLLALSLNGTTDQQRERLIPHTRTWPIGDLLEALREDQRRRSGRRHGIGYVLWDGVNDGDEDARRLVHLLDGLSAHVNLIPHNPYTGSELRPPAEERLLRFQALVREGGVRCLIRRPRGQDIAAACGQLAGKARA
jgi:23S rRNA (adenine2503-C2)-methyltransferase